jgi:hypothetical protein
LTRDDEQVIVGETKQWLMERSESSAAYRGYLSSWGDWQNPWPTDEPQADAAP